MQFEILRETFTETFELLKQAYAGDALGRTKCYEWFTRLKNGRQTVKDDPWPATHSKNIKDLSFYLVRADRRLTVGQLQKKLVSQLGHPVM